MTTQVIQIHLSDGSSKNVRVDSFTTVQRIVNVVLEGLGMDRLSFGHFALRLASFSGGLGSIASDTQWLHPALRMPEIASRYISPLNSGLQMRFELRIRFVPRQLHEMYQTQMSAFLYLYDQLVKDYVDHVSWKIDTDKAFHMGALILRKRFPNLTSLIDEEGGLLKYLPESIVVTTKKKQLHKQVITSLKEVIHLTELEAVFKFMKYLMGLARFDTEIFRVSFGTSWERPVELYVGQHFGIAYKNENTKEPVSLADLRNVIDISVRRQLLKSEQCTLKIKISGNTTPMVITTSTINMAESLAHLIDGYQMILSQQRSVWINQDLKAQNELEVPNKSNEERRKKSETLSPLVRKRCVVPPSDLPHQNNVESASLVHSMHIDPNLVRLEELLGSGQYGNVYRGHYNQNDRRTQVAIKVCKTDADGQDANKFLMEEAYTMSQFHHKHIIQLIGVSCANSIVWVVLELANLGELRQYLKREQTSIDLSIQLLFSKQLADAIAYLTKHAFVHRDIAARNCLVSTPKSVKLSDFGMCRLLDEDVYNSTSPKLPLKWMALESLKYRKFTRETDVYMLGVCIWEILTFGEKPWQSTRNHEVVIKLERGEILPQPENCPVSIYEMLREMWHLDPKQRTEIFDVYAILKDFLLQLDSNVLFEDLTLNRKPKRLPSTNVVPVLRIPDTMDIEPSVIQQTLEQQRLQSIEDERWLHEQEQIIFPPEEFETRPKSFERKTTPLRSEFEQEQDPLFMAISDVSDSIYEFTTRSGVLSNADFVNAIEKILYQLDQLNNVSAPHFQLLENPYRKKVEFAQKLLNTNANNLRQTIRNAMDIEPLTVESNHREALNICNVLIIHSKQFLDAIDVARLSTLQKS
ncbi:hypothetical protein M3Y97_00362400 [Aphelenchoides bicaudatus]|nr:hypothetical protein M3Y97_00362400 [Aphelenchoides bicaudatus]